MQIFLPVQDPGDQIAAQSIFLPHYHRFFSSAQQERRMLQGTDMTFFSWLPLALALNPLDEIIATVGPFRAKKITINCVART